MISGNLSALRPALLGIRALALLSVLCTIALAAASSVNAQDFPELTGRVVDKANILTDEDEAEITSQLEALENSTTRQFAVATISTLQGYEIADYGNRLARHWQLGQAADGSAEKDNGILLLIAPNERQMRIEVGYGLEGVMTDALASHIISETIRPDFRDNYMARGTKAGVARIITQLELPPDEAQTVLDELAEDEWYGNAAMIGLAVLIVGFGIWTATLGPSGGNRRGGRGITTRSGGSSGRSRSSGWSGGGGSFGGGGASGGW